MCFKSAGVPLSEPLRTAAFFECIIKPQSAGCGMESFTVDYFSGKADLMSSGCLLEIAKQRCLKSSRTLLDHLFDRPDVTKIKTVGSYPVYPYIPYHQHPKVSFTFSLRADQSCQ
jgi:hypothetical protein